MKIVSFSIESFLQQYQFNQYFLTVCILRLLPHLKFKENLINEGGTSRGLSKISASSSKSESSLIADTAHLGWLG
jgi:ubiquinone biosynthesis protein COQ9